MTYGVVLAGGRSRRYGREKALADLSGRPLIAWVAGVMRSGVAALAVSARPGSGAQAWADGESLPSLVDAQGPLAGGPLAGVLEGLRWAREAGATSLLTSPCDTPLLPADFPARLADGREAGGAVARTAEGVQPLCALWPVSALERLERLDHHPPVKRMLKALGAAEVAFDDAEAFRNINTPDDLAAAAARLR